MPDVNECSICLDDLDNGPTSLVTEVACGNRHRFHEICFRRYTMTQRNMNVDSEHGLHLHLQQPKIVCPLCRNTINQEIVIIYEGEEDQDDCKTRYNILIITMKFLFLAACFVLSIYFAAHGI
jgi:hypothetical protein